MDLDWSPYYQECPSGAIWWDIITSRQEGDWPPHLRVEGGHLDQRRIYLQGRLIVPRGLVRRVLMAHHQETGHMGVERMEKSILRQFWLCPCEKAHREILREVKGQCQVCQACEPPNWSTHGAIEMTPVPGRCMVHVALDIFSIEPTTYQDREYDSILLCVDRLSGWTVADTCTKKGLPTEKAAQLMLEKWEMFGVPEVITSDRGQHFIGAWWRTMCARLGVRQAHSIAYRS